MKQKIFLVLFIVFLLIAGIAGYKFFSAELDYRNASVYYETLAETWVKDNSAGTASAQASAVPSETARSSVPAQDPGTEQITDAGQDSVPGQESSPGAAQEPSPVPEQDQPFSGPVQASEPEKEQPQAEPPVQSPDNLEMPEQAGIDPVVADAEPQGRFTTEQPPITVDFDGLCGINPDIVGWIYCEDTPISYPVLQGKDNKKYLIIQPDGKTSGSGSVFIDCNCDRNFTNDNTIMYGHNLKNKMFACLSRYSSQSYYDNHSVMWLLTPNGNYRIELFAGFIIKDGGWVYVIDLLTPADWSKFTNSCLKASKFKSSFQPEPGDRLITLSTCNYSFDNARYVVVGSLVRSVKK